MEFWLNYIIIIILYIILYQSWTNLKLVSKSNDFFLDSLGRIVRK